MGGARVVYAMAHDGLFFRRMGRVHPRYRTPDFALIAQAVLSCAIALTGTYDQLFTYTVFGMVLSYLATIFGLFILRRIRPDLPRPYRCWGYPWMPALYLVLIAGGWRIRRWSAPAKHGPASCCSPSACRAISTGARATSNPSRTQELTSAMLLC